MLPLKKAGSRYHKHDNAVNLGRTLRYSIFLLDKQEVVCVKVRVLRVKGLMPLGLTYGQISAPMCLPTYLQFTDFISSRVSTKLVRPKDGTVPSVSGANTERGESWLYDCATDSFSR